MASSATPRKEARSGTWWFVVDLPAGPGGQRRQAKRRGFKTKREAQEVLDRLRVSAREGSYVAPHRQRVDAYVDRWLESLAVAGRAESTLESYGRNLRNHVVPYVGGLRLQELTPQHLDRLYAALLTQGRRRGNGGLSPRSVRYIHTIIGHALADAVRKDLVVRNVSEVATPPSAKSAKPPEMQFWTPAELQQFLGYVADHHHFALFRLASMTGMRRGEVCGLKWNDVDLAAPLVRVRRQLVVIANPGGPKKLVLEDHPKSDAGRRTIDIDDATALALRKQRAAQAEHRLGLGAGYRDHGFVFTKPDGSHLHPERVAEAFDWHHRKAGLLRIRFHDLRHTHCAHLIAAGEDVKSISARMGHSSVAFTLDRYGHLLPNAGSRAASAVAALVDGTRP